MLTNGEPVSPVVGSTDVGTLPMITPRSPPEPVAVSVAEKTELEMRAGLVL